MCQNCKNVEFEHIHHIDEDPSNNEFSNLMLLCSKCHVKEHNRLRMLDKKYTNQIRIFRETYNRLYELGMSTEKTFDDLINRCIDSHERVIKPAISLIISS